MVFAEEIARSLKTRALVIDDGGLCGCRKGHDAGNGQKKTGGEVHIVDLCL
jgi:hypothetical protein